MTQEEFDKIESIKREIDELIHMLNGKWGSKSKYCNIIKIEMRHIYSNIVDDVEVRISKSFEKDILKLAEQRLKNLQEEFNNFKTK